MFISDLKYSARLLLKKPGFTFLSALVMASGVGLSLYLFSIFNTMMFKDLPFKESDSLVVFASALNGLMGEDPIDFHDYEEIRTQLQGASEFGAYTSTSANISRPDGARQYNTTLVEPNFFQLTRTKPILGREFTKADNQRGAENVVVIGYEAWQNLFSGDPKVIEQSLRVNGEKHRIIGVMPSGYFFPYSAKMWLPLRQDADKIIRGQADKVYGIAHLDDGVSINDINHQLSLIMQRLAEQYPKTNQELSAYATPLPLLGMPNKMAFVYSMDIIAILILFLASTNVGNLLLSRAVERRKETAIRVALGAPRLRLVSQMLWESLIICSIGGIIGLFVIAWGLEVTNSLVKTFFEDPPPFWWQFGIDSFTLKLFIGFFICTVLCTGLYPAWKNSNTDFNSVLRDGTRGALGKKSGRLNRLLVISQIFISTSILIASGVVLLSNYKESHADYGVDTSDIIKAEVQLPHANYETLDKKAQLIKTLTHRLEDQTGIANVMISSALPGQVVSETSTMAVEGREYNNSKGLTSYPRAYYNKVTTGSLKKLGIELKQGRYFNLSDEGLDKNTVIVTESFTDRHFPQNSAIGKRLRIINAENSQTDWLTIIGVVEHTIYGPSYADRERKPSVFRPFSQHPSSEITVAMRMKSDKSVAIRTLRQTLHSIDPELPAFSIETYAKSIDRHNAPSRWMSTIFFLFGAVALVLAVSGIYGVMSNTANQKTQEIGVKQALGASEQRISKEFLLTGFKQFLWGGIPGSLLGAAMAFAMASSTRTENIDIAIVGTLIVLTISYIVMLAVWLPTKRSLRMEPSQALHYE